MNRLTIVLLGLVRQQRQSRPSIFDERTALYLIGDHADSVVPEDACKVPDDDQQLLRLLRKISPTKEVGVQASMCAARLAAELGARGKVWAINPSQDSVGLVLDDFRLSVDEGSATKAVICFAVTASPKGEYWPEGSNVREVVRILGVDGWSEAGSRRMSEILCADLARTGGGFE